MRLGFEGPRATARTLMKEGDTLFAALSWSEHAPPADYEEAYERMVWTAHHWQHWLDRGEFPDHPWRSSPAAQRAHAEGPDLRAHRAMMAAATTSLPETPGGERNWDYRYTWIRDSTFTLWGLYTLGFDWEANDFFYFVADVAEAEQGELQIMYGIDGERELAEETLDHLLGLRGRAAGPHRQRRLRPGPARRLGRGARLGSTCTPSRATTCPSGSGRSSSSRSRRRSSTGASPTAASGRCAASRSTSRRPR